MEQWTVSLTFRSDRGLPYLGNAAQKALLHHVAGGHGMVVLGEDHLGLTFDVPALDVETALAVAKTTADESLRVADLPALRIAKITVTSRDEREAEDARIPDLVGVAEIAGLLDVSKQRVVQLASTRDFPAPATRLESGRVWMKPAIVEFKGKRERKRRAAELKREGSSGSKRSTARGGASFVPPTTLPGLDRGNAKR